MWKQKAIKVKKALINAHGLRRWKNCLYNYNYLAASEKIYSLIDSPRACISIIKVSY